MAHLVRYSSPEGEERYEDVADLDAAVDRVEHLRNAEGVSDVRVYREVPLEFRTYVRVAVADDEAGSSPRPESGRPETGRGTGGSADASSSAGSSSGAPSGAAVISPPPASATRSSDDQPSAVQADASAPEADVEASAVENRRISLFNRGGQAS